MYVALTIIIILFDILFMLLYLISSDLNDNLLKE